MRQYLQTLRANFLFFLELQLLICLTMLPILIAWGLPISLMSIAGNLLFAQFLTLFICVSALFFITNLIGLPNSFIAQALELISQIWHYCLSISYPQWLIGFSSWMLPISCGFTILACRMYYHKNISQKYRISLLALFCLLTYTIHQVGQKKSIFTSIQRGQQKMHLIKHAHNIYAFDCGALGARASSQSWIEYDFKKFLITTMGSTKIDTLIICKSNSRTPQAVQDFINLIPTTQIIYIQKPDNFL